MAPAILLALTGGFIRWMRGGECSIWTLVVGVLSAGFAGILAFLFLEGTSIAPTMRGAVVGVAGYAGGDLLQVLSRRVCRIAMGVDERK